MVDDNCHMIREANKIVSSNDDSRSSSFEVENIAEVM